MPEYIYSLSRDEFLLKHNTLHTVCLHYTVYKIPLPISKASCFHAIQLKIPCSVEKKKIHLCLVFVLPVECLSTHAVVLCYVETDFMTAVNSEYLGMHLKHLHVKWTQYLTSVFWVADGIACLNFFFFCNSGSGSRSRRWIAAVTTASFIRYV